MKDSQYSEKGRKIAVKVDGLTVRYGGNEVLADICLDVEEGEYLGIIGPNGGGKTTLLKALLGLIQPSEGSVSIYGTIPGRTASGSGKGVNREYVRIGYVPQASDFDREFPITVREVVMTGRLTGKFSPFHKYTPEDVMLTDGILEKAGMAKLSGRVINGLSGGEFQKMLIARALVLEPRILLLDEPTANIDTNSQEQIYKLFAELSSKMTIIMVTHDFLAISSQVRKLACLNRKLIYHGGAELNEDIVNKLYGCPVDLIAHGVPHRVLKEHGGKEAEAADGR